jgi:hypothetical protein
MHELLGFRRSNHQHDLIVVPRGLIPVEYHNLKTRSGVDGLDDRTKNIIDIVLASAAS